MPFAVWGPGIAPADLYDLNPGYRDPGRTRPGLRGKQPVRNGDVANLALRLLGLDPVPGSLFGAKRTLAASEAEQASPVEASRRRRPRRPRQATASAASWQRHRASSTPRWRSLLSLRLRQRSSAAVGHGLKRHPSVPFDCCIITGASLPGPGQPAWPLPSQWPVSWLTTRCR